MLNYILEFIERNQDSVIIVFIVAIIQLYIANRFQRKLETHKGDVNSKIEDVKHKQQRIFKEFDLYTTKMHEVYPELYKKVEYAYGEVTGLRGITLVIDLHRLNQEEFEEHLKGLDSLADTEKAYLLSLFSVNKDEAVTQYHNKMEWVRYHKANSRLTEANNYFIVSELYLTDESASASRELLNQLRKYWNDLNPEYNGDSDVTRDRQVTRDHLPSVKKTFRLTLKEDLKRSFSD